MSLSNQPGTPRDDGEMGGNFLNPFQSESVSIPLTTLLYPKCISKAFLLEYIHKAIIMTAYLELNRLIF